MKNSTKTQAAKPSKTAKVAKPATTAKVVVKKSAAELAHSRSMAAYKAHITRHTNLIEAANHGAIKVDSREAIKAIIANMNAA